MSLEEEMLKLEKNLMPTNSFGKKLISVVEKKEPFSFVRLGDGEGALLDLNNDSSFFDIKYLSEHFGLDCTLNEALQIKKILLETILNADFVGIRSDVVNVSFQSRKINNSPEFMDNFKKSFNLRDVDKNLCYADARRITMLHKIVSQIDFSPKTEYVCSSIGWDIYRSGALPYILSKQKKIGVISSKKALGNVISAAFGIEVVNHTIPDKFELVQKHGIRHYPTAYYDVINKIKVDSPGMVFLVGGGIVGKGYCNEIKRQGGIALDLGGVLDSWVGLLSRIPPLKERYELKKSWKIRMRKKIIPTLVRTYDLPEELIMNKESVQLLTNRWLENPSTK